MKTKNKTRYLQSILGAILAVSAALVLSCEQLDGPSAGAPTGKGSIALTISTGAPNGSVLRTYGPTKPTFSRYELVFTKGDGELKETLTAEVDADKLSTFEQPLDVGTWKVAVTGYQNLTPVGGTADEHKAAYGEKDSVTVEAGKLVSVEVEIKPLTPGEDETLPDGLFTYSVTYPDGATGTLTLTAPGEPPTVADTVELEGSTSSGGTISLPPGQYTLRISLTLTTEDDVELATGTSASVYIYAGQETTATDFEFDEDKDFVSHVYLRAKLPPLDGNLVFNVGEIGVYTEENDDESKITLTDPTVTTDGLWYAEIGVENITKSLYIKAVKVNGDATYTATGTVENLTEAGAEVPLDYAITKTNPAGGTVTVDYGNKEVEIADSFTVSNGVTVTVGTDNDEGKLTVTEGATLNVAGGGTLEVKKGTLEVTGDIAIANQGTLTVDSGATIEVAGALTVTGDLTVETAGGLVLNGQTATGKNDDEVTGSVTVKDGGKLELKNGAKLTVSGEVNQPQTQGSVFSVYGILANGVEPQADEKGVLKVSGTLVVDATSTLTIAPTGKLQVEDSGTLTVNGVLNAEVAAVDKLAGAIATAKLVGEEAAGKGVVLLTSDFYTAANNGNTALVVDAGETRNTKPYTIKGLGTGEEDEELTVGILLANDYVTLDGVKINITTSTKGAITEWATSHGASAKYWAGVSVTRSADGATVLDNADMVSNNVTVKNCNITFTQTANFTSGIYVSARVDDSATGNASPQNITLTGNTISVDGKNTSAQAIFFRRYNASVEITNNILSSTNTVTTNAYNGPASAIYMNIVAGDFSDSDTPKISGNTLSGVFDFDITVPRVPYASADFVPNAFGTANSTWATATSNNSNFYKKVYNALISQAKKDGYGLIMLYLGSTIASTNFAIEQYETTNGAVTAIDYWGPGISDSAYAEGKNVTTSAGGGIRDRITVTSGTPDASSTSSNVFHWTRSVTGSDFPAQ